MNEVISLKNTNCKDCYKCIRNCHVKAISFSEGQAHIVASECILCGQCYVSCPHDAVEIRSDFHRIRTAMRAGKKIYASLAPSFITDFEVGGIEDMTDGLKKLGFDVVEETAMGAEVVSKEYDRIMEKGEQSIIITSACPTVNNLIQKHHPMVLPHLARVLSPMQAHGKMIREKDPNAFIVFIGPCIAKKAEADETKYIDAALTFDELRQWLTNEKVTLQRRNIESDGQRARLYPTLGGLLKTVHPTNGYRLMAIDGVEDCLGVFRELESGSGRLNKVFIEMSACEGSCINGPAICDHMQARISGHLSVSEFAGEQEYGLDMPGGVSQTFATKGIRRIMPGNEAIRSVLNRMGKTSPDKELNCGSCGYATCRDKAIAICQGKAEIGMCLPFLKEKAESFSDKIISSTPNAIFVLNEDLIVQQINKAAMKLFKLTSPEDIVQAPIVRLLDPSDYLNVVLSGRGSVNKRRYIAEYKIFVEETIIYDKQYKILISIMRDVTEQERSRAADQELRKQTVEITDNVINKHMRVVQEIASLLGETTAETKIALTKLKDAIKHE